MDTVCHELASPWIDALHRDLSYGRELCLWHVMVKFYVELFFGVAVGAFQEAPEKKKYKDCQSPSHCVPAPFAQGSLRREIRESPLRMVGESALLIYFQPQRSVARIHAQKAHFMKAVPSIHATCCNSFNLGSFRLGKAYPPPSMMEAFYAIGFSAQNVCFIFQFFKKFCQNPNKIVVRIVYNLKRLWNNKNSLLNSVAVYILYTVAYKVQLALPRQNQTQIYINTTAFAVDFFFITGKNTTFSTFFKKFSSKFQ